MILALGAKMFGKFMLSKQEMLFEHRGDHVHEHYTESFFVMASICQLIALVPAVFCWWTQSAAAKEKMLKEQGDDDL